MSDPRTTSIGGVPIASQCCDDTPAGLLERGGCRRRVSGALTSTDENCFGGMPPRGYTFAQAEVLCLEAGLDVCDRSCKGMGCGYNHAYVWTKNACPTSWVRTMELVWSADSFLQALTGSAAAGRRLAVTWGWDGVHPAQQSALQPQLNAQVLGSVDGDASVTVNCTQTAAAVPPAPAPLTPFCSLMEVQIVTFSSHSKTK